ncbi:MULTISPECIES: protein-L-isoaspartate O-methyltransferase family protein [unclassified Francisella]|uniref:protein-L-isoaspartate O-methyltransferase family protein n=1 Tax=unclassified Francisella TaxID=2610885 RepID=UPI002E30A49D|nr:MULTISPECIES: protein-L-isoaspartate O-methyltransferase [unclassified Francisella]MED7818965.1 protein-L-isoaspartate O-methyltransferase [Francisella sp. 19S2-4]MED7829802.1 protein-L-isoaspartate O-methyltransferase [Francisella sp. 19S2-10]
MNFEFARENMIKQQVLTEGLALDGVAKVMADVPREIFFPKNLQGLAYCDTPLLIEDRQLRSPMLTARLIEALDIKASDSVLKLGLECGYPAALLAKLAKNVELIDFDEQKLSQVRRQLADISIYNIEFNSAEYLTNIKKNAKKYNCIYISNIVAEDEIDSSLLELLEVGGRVVFVVRNDVCDKVYIIKKTANKKYEKSFLFDTYNK